MSETIIHRWESRSGKHWVELVTSPNGLSYTSPTAGGSLGLDTPEARARFEREMVDTGYFLPDAHQTPMVRA